MEKVGGCVFSESNESDNIATRYLRRGKQMNLTHDDGREVAEAIACLGGGLARLQWPLWIFAGVSSPYESEADHPSQKQSSTNPLASPRISST